MDERMPIPDIRDTFPSDPEPSVPPADGSASQDPASAYRAEAEAAAVKPHAHLADSPARPVRTKAMDRDRSFLMAAVLICGLTTAAAGLVKMRLEEAFERRYERYLDQAVATPDPEVALVNLQRAIRYAEANRLTRGNTRDGSDPKNDLAIWHDALTRSYAELSFLTPATTVFDRRLALTRLRERLIDPVSARYRYPEDLPLYPRHRFYEGFFYGSQLAAGLFFLAFLFSARRR